MFTLSPEVALQVQSVLLKRFYLFSGCEVYEGLECTPKKSFNDLVIIMALLEINYCLYIEKIFFRSLPPLVRLVARPLKNIMAFLTRKFNQKNPI